MTSTSVDVPASKNCTKCKVSKTLDCYYYSKKASDHRASECKQCATIRKKQRNNEIHLQKVQRIENDDPTEEWKDIIDYEGLYKISNKGRILSYGHYSKYGIVNQTTNRGYFYITLYKDQIPTTFTVHRLIARHFIPNPENFPVVDHIDRNRQNNDISNLRWCTQALNCKNRTYKGSLKLDQFRNKGGSIHQWYRVRWTERSGVNKEKTFRLDDFENAQAFLNQTIERLNSEVVN